MPSCWLNYVFPHFTRICHVCVYIKLPTYSSIPLLSFPHIALHWNLGSGPEGLKELGGLWSASNSLRALLETGRACCFALLGLEGRSWMDRFSKTDGRKERNSPVFYRTLFHLVLLPCIYLLKITVYIKERHRDPACS